MGDLSPRERAWMERAVEESLRADRHKDHALERIERMEGDLFVTECERADANLYVAELEKDLAAEREHASKLEEVLAGHNDAARAQVRDAALEEAVRVADEEMAGSKRNLAERATAERIATSIRSLKGRKP